MSESTATIHAAELALGIGRRGAAFSGVLGNVDSNRAWGLGMIILGALVMRLLLLWLGPLGDPARAADAESAAYITAAQTLGVAGVIDASDVPAVPAGIERMAPGYPAFLALANMLPSPTGAVLLVQAGLWAVTVLLVARAAWSLCGGLASGFIAAGIVALHPAAIVATATALPETLAAAGIALGVCVAAERENRRFTTAAIGGLGLGVAAVTAPLTWLLGVPMAVWMLISDRRLCTVVAAAGFVAGSVAPAGLWIAYGAAQRAEPVTFTEALDPAENAGVSMLTLAAGHGMTAACQRLGLSVPAGLPGPTALDVDWANLSGLGAGAAALWMGFSGMLIVVAAVGTGGLMLRGRWSAGVLGLLTLSAVVLAIRGISEPWRAQALLTPALAILAAGLCAEGRFRFGMLRRRGAGAQGDEEMPVVCGVGRPL